MQTIFRPRASDRANREVSNAVTYNILLVENDDQLAQLIIQELDCEGYQITLTKDGISGLLAARQANPHLIIVSWALIGVSCIEFCHRLRSTYNNVPIIVLTHEGQVSERVMGLNAGASDCLSKPFAIEELIARIRAHLREGAKETYLLKFERLVLSKKARQVYYENREIELTAKEFDLLEYLMRHPNQVLTRLQILDDVWGCENFTNSNVIEVYIRYLRIKLKAQGAKQLIHTVRGIGYVLRITHHQN
ncbi:MULTISPECIES: response regulator transcription factor [unclassified Leptolyngbya]|nr:MULTISPECIES: response regulator transcription factor [unclassified Leptolyngbya]MBD1919426.1 response regulator transcription factor [Phormidium sp. FACHB-77]MBD2035232.1 response regulator transcription factor [Leptolyngbya sp. FACHB-321]MBD2054356.1 response regulator transcription factor [Leptolyngbya sp. FACHB-60]